MKPREAELFNLLEARLGKIRGLEVRVSETDAQLNRQAGVVDKVFVVRQGELTTRLLVAVNSSGQPLPTAQTIGM